MSVAPGPTAMTVASGSGLFVELEGKKIPVAVFVSGLNRWTRTRSKRGTSDLMDLNVACAAIALCDENEDEGEQKDEDESATREKVLEKKACHGKRQ